MAWTAAPETTTTAPHVFLRQMLVDHLHSYLQPWFKADIQRILDEPDIAEIRNGKYVGMHIRRTDKANEIKLTKTEVCSATRGTSRKDGRT